MTNRQQQQDHYRLQVVYGEAWVGFVNNKTGKRHTKILRGDCPNKPPRADHDNDLKLRKEGHAKKKRESLDRFNKSSDGILRSKFPRTLPLLLLWLCLYWTGIFPYELINPLLGASCCCSVSSHWRLLLLAVSSVAILMQLKEQHQCTEEEGALSQELLRQFIIFRNTYCQERSFWGGERFSSFHLTTLSHKRIFVVYPLRSQQQDFN